MGLLNQVRRKYKEDGVSGVLEAAPPYARSKLRLGVKLPHKYYYDKVGYSIYDQDWDLLIILDGCRYDLLEEVADEFGFLSNLNCEFSRASSSKQWMEKNFSDEYASEMENTVYVTGNPYTAEAVVAEDFEYLDEVWRDSWDEQIGTIPPRAITDRVIDQHRSTRPSYLIGHYMQPHFPSLVNPELGGKVDPKTNTWINSVWEKLENGQLDHDTVWEEYRTNLERVLDEVELLLENVDANDVVITSDHGNGFGENGIYGHPSGEVSYELRSVPWIVTTGTDKKTYTPTVEEGNNSISVDQQLEALGYKEY